MGSDGRAKPQSQMTDDDKAKEERARESARITWEADTEEWKKNRRQWFQDERADAKKAILFANALHDAAVEARKKKLTDEQKHKIIDQFIQTMKGLGIDPFNITPEQWAMLETLGYASYDGKYYKLSINGRDFYYQAQPGVMWGLFGNRSYQLIGVFDSSDAEGYLQWDRSPKKPLTTLSDEDRSKLALMLYNAQQAIDNQNAMGREIAIAKARQAAQGIARTADIAGMVVSGFTLWATLPVAGTVVGALFFALTVDQMIGSFRRSVLGEGDAHTLFESGMDLAGVPKGYQKWIELGASLGLGIAAMRAALQKTLAGEVAESEKALADLICKGGCFVAGTQVEVSPSEPDLDFDFNGSSFGGDPTSPATIAVVPQKRSTVTISIEQVKLGMRVPGRNPRRDAVDPRFPEPDKSTWCALDLVHERSDGSRVEIELLRPKVWVSQLGLKVGRILPTMMPELSVDGVAMVAAIKDCPQIASGDGNVCTGRFKSRATVPIVSLFVEGDAEPISGTANHPVWSEDRQDWVAIGELRTGEQLRGRDGALYVEKIEPYRVASIVYNLETSFEHVYNVARSGVLAHNNDIDDCIRLANKLDELRKEFLASSDVAKKAALEAEMRATQKQLDLLTSTAGKVARAGLTPSVIWDEMGSSLRRRLGHPSEWKKLGQKTPEVIDGFEKSIGTKKIYEIFETPDGVRVGVHYWQRADGVIEEIRFTVPDKTVL
jgi:hypothetical protein